MKTKLKRIKKACLPSEPMPPVQITVYIHIYVCEYIYMYKLMTLILFCAFNKSTSLRGQNSFH